MCINVCPFYWSVRVPCNFSVCLSDIIRGTREHDFTLRLEGKHQPSILNLELGISTISAPALKSTNFPLETVPWSGPTVPPACNLAVNSLSMVAPDVEEQARSA